jgi:hypothetical protein
MKLLADFWEKKGRIFVLLNPFAQTPHLTNFLNSVGVLPQEDRIIRTGKFLQQDQSGNPQLVTGVINNPAFVVADSRTSITKDIEGMTKQLLGATQSLAVDKSHESVAKVNVIPLLQSAEGFWGATDLTGGENKQVYFDPKRDHMGPLNIAVAVEKGGLQDQRVKMDSSRMVVVGNGEMLTNNAYRLSEGASLDITINILNWLLNREEVMGIPPKEKTTLTISLNETQLRNIAVGVMGIVPGIVALFGLIVWWQRRA